MKRFVRVILAVIIIGAFFQALLNRASVSTDQSTPSPTGADPPGGLPLTGPSSESSSAPINSSAPGKVARHCEYGNPIGGRFFVKSGNVNFRKGPGTKYDLVVNKRATEVIGSTEYRTLDPAMVLEGVCASDEWLQAKIVEADGRSVNWESGWVARQFVTDKPSAEMAAGLFWNPDDVNDLTADEKTLLKRGALRVLEDEPKCAKVIYGHRDTFTKGDYYVTCASNTGGDNFNAFFSPSALDAGGKVAIPQAFDETASRRGCEKAIRDRVARPSTLDIHEFIGYATKVHDNGNRTIFQDFIAANRLGLEVEHRARCVIDPDGSLEITIVEK